MNGWMDGTTYMLARLKSPFIDLLLFGPCDSPKGRLDIDMAMIRVLEDLVLFRMRG